VTEQQAGQIAALASALGQLDLEHAPLGALAALLTACASTGMSRGWLYREARAGRLPFARRLGRRLAFDEAGLQRWLDRRRVG